MKTAETPVGIFTINKVKIPSAYTCAAEQKIEYISENHMQIITMDQAVLFGNQLLSPRICQSCMNPDKITIYPKPPKKQGKHTLEEAKELYPEYGNALFFTFFHTLPLD